MQIVPSHIREQALARMLCSSPMAIFGLLLGRSPPPLSNSGVVGSEWLGLWPELQANSRLGANRKEPQMEKDFG